MNRPGSDGHGNAPRALSTVNPAPDSAYHPIMSLRPLLICIVLMASVAGAADAKDYSAERFDARIEVLRGGTIRVTEEVLVRFENGSFTQFYREIPSGRTDGLEIVSASMDGVALPPGDGPGHVEVRRRSRTRVTWRFPSVSGSSHIFSLSYIVRGAVRQGGDADVVAWRALPGEHAYRIDSSTIDFALPAEPGAAPTLELRRVGDSSVVAEGTQVRIRAREIRANGWIEAWVRLPRGSVIEAPPQWQQRELAIRESANVWIIAAAGVLTGGLLLIFGVRQGYDAPPREAGAATVGPNLPDTLPPALAGALVANGSARLEHAMAAVFSLADRGELVIEEQARSLGQRNFLVTRTGSGRPLAAHEQRALEVIFTGKSGLERSVALGTARSRLTKHLKKFSGAVTQELAAAGLMDEDREAVRHGFLRIGTIALIAAGVAALALSSAVDRYGAWPMLIPAALAVVGVIALICHAAHTPLSNSAVRRAQGWRSFRRYLRDVARDRQASPQDATLRQWLPFAVAVGIAPAWAAYLKRHRGGAPQWFHAVGKSDGTHAFAAFVGAGGAGSSHGTSGGCGGAAGGGSSGAC
jgi:hypothetical protein